MTTRRRLLVGAALAVCWLVATTGCTLNSRYVVHAVFGQLDLIANADPVQQVLDRGPLTDAQREKLLLILDVRQYTIDVLGLTPGTIFTTYVDTGDEPVSYNLSASAKDAFRPRVWEFPIVGATEYLGFFNLDFAKEYRDALVADGWDTVIYPIRSYSTLGLFDDPITSTMLAEPDASLIDLIIHEITHNTVFREDDVAFSENLAVFIARVGTQMYVTDRFGADSPLLVDADETNFDMALYNAFLARLRDRLTVLYNSDKTYDEKLAERQVYFDEAHQEFADDVQPMMIDPDVYSFVLDTKFNNAWLLLNARYTQDLSVFEDVYASTGNDFSASLQIFRAAAQTNNAIGYLRDVASP